MQPDSTGTFRDDLSKEEASLELLDSSQSVYYIPSALRTLRSGFKPQQGSEEPEFRLTAQGQPSNVQQELLKTLQLRCVSLHQNSDSLKEMK